MSSSIDTNSLLTTTDKESSAYATQLMFSSALPMTLQAAIELGIFEIIAKAGDGAKLSSSEIALQITTRNPNAPMMIERILLLLASHNIVTNLVEDAKIVFGLAPVAKYFISDQNGLSLGSILALVHDKISLVCWSQLKEAVVEGGNPFERAYGVTIYEYAATNSKFNEIFNAGMIHHSVLVITSMLEVYKGFDNIKQLVDVGGNLGITLKAITSKYPRIKGINFDLPHVIQQAPHCPGVEHVSGNMSESVPKGDAILMKCVLNDWSDDQCLTLLRNCYNSIPDKGKVIVIEKIASLVKESDVEAKATSLNDMIRIALVSGGKMRTRDEIIALATAVGFSGIRFVCSVCSFWVMEIYK